MNTHKDAQELRLVPKMTEQERMTYAQKLKSARTQAGKTQDEVATEAGIARNTYRDMESGKKIPQTDKLWSAMLVLGLGAQEASPEWLQEWWAIIEPLAKRLPEDKRGEVMGQVVTSIVTAISSK